MPVDRVYSKIPLIAWAQQVQTWVTARQPTAWTAVSFGANWANYGGEWQVAQYRKVEDVVYMRGLVTNTAAVALNAVVCTLPVGFRPSLPVSTRAQMYNMSGAAGTQDGAHRVDVLADGTVIIKQAMNINGWLSLSNIFFAV